MQPFLPAGLRARSEERVPLETVQHDPMGRFRSDIAVLRSPQAEAGDTAAEPSVEPFLIDYYDRPEVDRFLQIIDMSNGNRVVTAIEVLSRWNKGPGRLNVDYRRKLDDYARGEISVLEIDLLRSSRGRLPVGQEEMPIDRRTPYLACVRRAWTPWRWELYPINARRPLPRVPVPLREKEAQVILDLQPLIERAYVAGGHDDIDYRRPPEPPLEGEDAAWADSLLKVAGRRQHDCQGSFPPGRLKTMPVDDILLDTEEHMDKSVEHLRHELRGVRTGRASPALVENIKVDYYGTPTDIRNIAAISIPEATQILIKPFNAADLKSIEKAINDSKIGLTPHGDGKQLRLILPALSQERRLQLAGQCKGYAEEAKIRIRNARRDGNKLIDTEEKGGVLTEDDAKGAKEQVQELTKTYEAKVEELIDHKRKEIMAV